MLLTVKLDMSNSKAPAFLNYLKSLDFVSFEEKYQLSDDERFAIEIGLKDLEEGNKLKHKDVMNNIKKRYPNLF
ncbi:MAG: hypothetical protein GXO49_08520 [Chlorobi bacterium]|nr:hypothetical protein [Chlorobiota bacterium]